LSGVLDSLHQLLAGDFVRRQHSAAKASDLQARQKRLAVSAERCSSGERSQRAEAKNGGRESETRELTEHTPNLGRDLAPGYIPQYGRAGP